MFISVGLVSFGGGYAVIPVIQKEVTEKGADCRRIPANRGAGRDGARFDRHQCRYADWLSVRRLYRSRRLHRGHHPAVAGRHRALSALFYRMRSNPWVQSSLYGLRPVTTGLIVYANYSLWVSR